MVWYIIDSAIFDFEVDAVSAREKARKLIESRKSIERIHKVLSAEFEPLLLIFRALGKNPEEAQKIISDLLSSTVQPTIEYLETLYCERLSEERLDQLCCISQLPQDFLELEQTLLRKAAARTLDLMISHAKTYKE